MTDEHILIAQAQNGDTAAVQTLLHRHRGIVISLAQAAAKRIGAPDSIDDAIVAGQLALVRAIQRWEPGRGVSLIGYAKPGIAGAAHDEIKSLRQHHSPPGGGTGDEGRQADALERSVVQEQVQGAIDDALNALPPSLRLVLRVHFGLDGHPPLTLDMIALVTNMTRDQVRHAVHAALDRMRCEPNVVLHGLER